MGRAVTPSQDCTAVAEREARALFSFCTGTCWDWSGWQQERVGPGPCLLTVSRSPEEWLRKEGRGDVLYAWMKKR